MAKRTQTLPVASNPDGITSITFESLNGHDEIRVWERACTQIGEQGTSLLLGMLVTDQSIAEALAEVNGSPVPVRPHIAWRDWDSATRDAVRNAWAAFHSGKAKPVASPETDATGEPS